MVARLTIAAPDGKRLQQQIDARARTVEDAYAEIIEEHGKTKGKRLIRQALRPVFSQLIARARAGTPVRTGALRRSVKVLPREKRGYVYSTRIGYFLRRRRVSGVVGIEFGNRRPTEEHAALRNAWRAEEPRVEGALAQAIEESVDQIVRRQSERARARMAAARA